MGLRRCVVNFKILRLSFGAVLGSIPWSPTLDAAGYGFDVLTPPAAYAHDLAAAGLGGRQGGWMRVRGVVEPSPTRTDDPRTVESDRAGLLALRARGIRTAVLLRWSPADWKSGVRAGGGQRHPLDLREAYERGRRLGAAYGDLVDVWEIENEPDIDFVAENPETHAAFQKAVYRGLHDGADDVQAASSASLSDKVKFKDNSGSGWLARKQGRSALNLKLLPSPRLASSRVVMAPLALPPGPYFERLWANGLASYTDGFNFHYYGYAEDFTGVYRQFESAVGRWKPETGKLLRTKKPETGNLKPEDGDGKPETGNLKLEIGTPDTQVSGLRSHVSSLRGGSGSNLNLKLKTSSDGQRKTLPVFITEYGYGLLDADARDTVEGRVRQWRWFASLAEQIRTLRPEGPMAFLLNPYYEANLNEFGLMMKARAAMKPETGNLKPEIDPQSENSGLSSQVSGLNPQGSSLSFSPSDFDQRKRLPWMRGIGQKVGDAYASPALAYLWDYAERHPYQARDWSVRAAPPSPVVIDLVADQDLVQAKRAGGYVVRGAPVEWSPVSVCTGRARLVLYNFGTAPVSGELVFTDPAVVAALPDAAITLAAGERREVPVEVRIPGEIWTPRMLGVRFVPAVPATGAAVFSTRLLPDTSGMAVVPVSGFAFESGAARARQAALLARPLAAGEPRLHPDGRWLVTDGVRVEERDGVWRFHIDHLPEEPLRPASVELPLPAGFAFESGTVLMLERRLGRQTKKPETGDLKPEIDPLSENSGLKSQVSGLSFQVSGRGSVSGLNSQLSTLSSQLAAPSRLKPRAGLAGDVMDVYFRAENGNLYQTWPRLRVGDAWTRYQGAADDFTMGFFGRAALPWRFAENRPVSLVFFLRPSQVPSVFEVRNARIVRFGADR